MKIIWLVGCLPAAIYFVNAIHKYHTVDLVIEELKAERGAWDKYSLRALLIFVKVETPVTRTSPSQIPACGTPRTGLLNDTHIRGQPDVCSARNW
jgi:hypothetical protein